MRFSNKLIISWLLMLSLAHGRGSNAEEKPASSAVGNASNNATYPSGPVVHEWGTFSTLSGSDGKNLAFNPYDNDLPNFVHGYLSKFSKAGPKAGTISLETPVLYFYSDKPLTASVEVDFPKGILTEWYPQAVRTDKRLTWSNIEVLAKEEVKFPQETKASRYYAARETDANPLRITMKQPTVIQPSMDPKQVFETKQGAQPKPEIKEITEQEKLLFYRGVGTFDLPLSVQAAQDGTFTVYWVNKASLGKAPQEDLILMRVQDGKIRFQPFRLKQYDFSQTDAAPKDGIQREVAKAMVRLSSKDASSEELGETLVKMLRDKGLYEKEARAMVKTWSSAWFGEEGTRILYIVPDALTEELLPLRVDPKPSSLVRVLIGRHDILTPDREKQIDVWVKELKRTTPKPDAEQLLAQKELYKLGRYTSAAWSASEARLKIGVQ